ncbi:MAG: hypothetical protein M3Y44_12160 [Actinomycetota bacterium]|nr:hypothetical protein [Actinomycetota bacterium]
MARPRVVFPALLCAATTTLAGCAATVAGHGSRGVPGIGASSGVAQSGPTPTDAPGLAALMQRGVASVTSAHTTFDVEAAGQGFKGAGDESLTAGKVTAFDLSETVSETGILRLRTVDGKTYVGLPPSLNHSGKPWALVTASSSDPVIRAMSTSIDSTQSATSLATPSAFVAAATSVKVDGPDQVNGAPATHYSIVADVTKLPVSYPGRQALIAAGLSTLPVELWIDSQGRPVKVSQHFTLRGQPVSSRVGLSRYNAPVHITAPPPDQVSTS